MLQLGFRPFSLLAPVSWVVLLFVVVPAIADDEEDDRFNAAYRAYNAAIESGNVELTITSAKAALDTATLILEPGDKRLAILMSNYGAALVDGGRFEEGHDIIGRAIDALIKSSGQHDPDLVHCYVSMATASGGFGNDARQLKWYKRALAVRGHNEGEESLSYAHLAYRAAVSVYEQSRSTKGEKYLREALAIYEKELGAASIEAGMANYQLGRFAFYHRDNRESSEYLLNALEAFDGDTDSDKAQRLLIRALLVQNYELLEESDNATKHCVAIGRESQVSPDQDYVPLFRLVPQYPHTQRRNGVEGHVALSFAVDEFGFVRNPKVIEEVVSDRSSGWNSVHSGFRDEAKHRSFGAAALAAVERYRYAPRFVDGVAVPVEDVTTRVTFKLAD